MANVSSLGKAVPTTASTIGTVGVAGNTGSVNVVWGVRYMSSQAPGLYSAGVTFEALAP